MRVQVRACCIVQPVLCVSMYYCMYVRVRNNYEVHTAVHICMACMLVRECAMLYMYGTTTRPRKHELYVCVCGLSVGRSVQHVSVLRAWYDMGE